MISGLFNCMHMLSSRYNFFHSNKSSWLIAFIQLLFKLWDTGSWAPVHAGFDIRACYYFVVDFFDAARGVNVRARARELLDWWNMFVYIV